MAVSACLGNPLGGAGFAGASTAAPLCERSLLPRRLYLPSGQQVRTRSSGCRDQVRSARLQENRHGMLSQRVRRLRTRHCLRPGPTLFGSGKIESACSFYWGPPCARAREGKCPQRQVCNPDAKISGKSCYDPIVSFVCPDRNLVCAKGRECIEKPTIDTACIFVDGPTIPQQQRTSTAPGKPERTSGPERTERPANPEQPRSRIAPGRSEGLLDPEKEDRR